MIPMEKKRKQLNIRTTDEFEQAVEDIRRSMSPIPSQTEAIYAAVFAMREKMQGNGSNKQ